MQEPKFPPPSFVHLFTRQKENFGTVFPQSVACRSASPLILCVFSAVDYLGGAAIAAEDTNSTGGADVVWLAI